VITAVVVIAIVLLAFGLVLALATEPGPSPAEVAVGYELAWDRLDFEALWALSGSELRDGLSRREFVAVKRAAYREQDELRRLAGHVAVEEIVVDARSATVGTRLELRDGAAVRNELLLARRDGRWQVVVYALTAEPLTAEPEPARPEPARPEPA
jgi:hypothetical protein